MTEKRKLAVIGGSSIASPLLLQELAKQSQRPAF
jgi:hypothetical protein